MPIQPIEEATLRRIAYIMGADSAAAKALAHADQLRVKGAAVEFAVSDRTFIVVELESAPAVSTG
ncbi:hypothetical protein ACMHYO_11630 [Allopusillimonas ginsengisoli]|uniref:hypothetical protein n=1 Tax=Allopusillimonas ginsengisoli TaxID=453575 RepID=UPI0039C2C3C5